jgi:hypothetical protein
LVGRVFGDAGVKKHLEQHVSEFVAQLCVIAATHGVEHLVGFLEKVATQRVVSLLALPGAGRAQLVHHRHRIDETLTRCGLRRGDQVVARGQSCLDSRMVWIRRQQNRRSVVFRRVRDAGPRRRERPWHLDRHLLGVLHITGQQIDGLDGDQRRAARVDQYDSHAAGRLLVITAVPFTLRGSLLAIPELRYINIILGFSIER